MTHATATINGQSFPCTIARDGTVNLPPEARAALPPHMRADGFYVDPPAPLERITISIGFDHPEKDAAK